MYYVTYIHTKIIYPHKLNNLFIFVYFTSEL